MPDILPFGWDHDRGGARGGLGGYSPSSEHPSPPSEGDKRFFFGDFWHLKHPKNHILAPSSEESAPRRKIPCATPGPRTRVPLDPPMEVGSMGVNDKIFPLAPNIANALRKPHSCG